MKEARVLLVKISLGRASARKNKLNQDQQTKLFSVEEKGEGHGFTIEMIPAIKKFGRYHRIITMPDNTEKLGDVFFKASHYAELSDTIYVRKGLTNFINKINRDIECYLNALQKPSCKVEKYFETFL